MLRNKKQQKKQKSQEHHTAKDFWRNLVWTYKLFWGMSKIDVIGFVLIQILLGVFPAITGLYFGRLVDTLMQLTREGVSGLEFSWNSPAIQYLIILALISTLSSFLYQVHYHIHDRFNVIHQRELRMRFFTTIGHFDLQHFENKKTADAIRRARDKYWDAEYFFRESIKTLKNLVTLITAASFILTFSIPLALAIILLSIPSSYFYYVQTLRSWKFYDDNTENFRKMWWTFGSLEDERRIPEHSITNAPVRLKETAQSIVDYIVKNEYDMRKKDFFENTFLLLFQLVYFVGTMAYLIMQTLNGEISIGQLTFFKGQISAFSNKFNEVLQNFVTLTQRSKTVGYLKNIFELQPVIKSGTKRLDTSKIPTIEFKNVSFKYPESDKYALRNISMKIEPGESIAIVGENGAGKTTLIKLLLRFYDPTEGEILIDGIPLPEIYLDDYKALIGALFQEFNRYDMLTVADNVSIGRPTQKPNTKRIKAALKEADALNFVKDLPKGLKQILNKRFSGGTNLSTGQWQKLAIARMFYRDPKILVLDEPTASIDAVAESKIFDRIYENVKNKTLIIISHRFSTVRMAEKIYVINKGRLVESGTHEELMKLGGQYKKAFDLQAGGYA